MDNGIGSVDRPKAVGNGMVACPAVFHTSSLAPTIPSAEATLGSHLARRLVEVGVSDVFAVPGDFNLTLLDHLIAEPGLRLVSCCNELNAGYAADGYARAKGVGTCAVTFTVGGLSVLNAIAGAYSENLPVICVVGGPNSQTTTQQPHPPPHHRPPRLLPGARCFQPVTCHQVVINNLDDAHEQVDKAIATALKESKPVYISVACNLHGVSHPTFFATHPLLHRPRQSSQMGLEAALDATVEFLSKAVKPVMVAGPKLRVAKVAAAFAELADASGTRWRPMPSAKGWCRDAAGSSGPTGARSARPSAWRWWSRRTRTSSPAPSSTTRAPWGTRSCSTRRRR
uniref:pyruvate decarboxylase n=1 Tax=Triticum urartu TaxID=4572 RepID=A0A8R7PLQ3_TRIUA